MLGRGDVTSVEALAARVKQHRAYVSDVIRLAFLNPHVTKAILEGRQRPDLRLADLLTTDIPLEWAKQAAMFL